MWTKKRIKKELEQFNQDPPCGWTAGPINDSDLYYWHAKLLGPENTPYEGGVFYLSIQFPKDYPFNPPKCIFSTKIFHPNILPNGKICPCCPLKELRDLWNPKLSISFILKRIRELLIEPYLEYSCGETEILNLYLHDKKEFDKRAKEWTIKYA